MAYIRKTKDEFEIQGWYSPQCGFEMVTCEESWKDAKLQIKCCRENEVGVPFRIVKKRVKLGEVRL